MPRKQTKPRKKPGPNKKKRFFGERAKKPGKYKLSPLKGMIEKVLLRA